MLGKVREMSFKGAFKASLTSGVLSRSDWKISRGGARGAAFFGDKRLSLDAGEDRVRMRGLWLERKSRPAVRVERVVQYRTLW